MEPLEDRRLLAVIAAGAGSNDIDVTLDAAWANVSVAVDGVPAGTFPVTEAITINGEGGNDTLTVDFAAGAPTLATFLNLTFNGGDGGDQVALLNGTMNQVTHQFTGPTAGSVQMTAGAATGTISYTGLEPITDNLNVANRAFTFTNTVTNGTLVTSPVTPATQTRIDSNQSESVDFTTPTTSLTVNLAAGNNTFTVTSLANNYITPTNTINGGANDDVVNFETTDGVVIAATPWTVNGMAGNDTVNLSPVAQNLNNLFDGVTFNGGTGGTDTLNVNDDNQGAASVFTVTSTTIDRSSWGDEANPGATYDAAVEVVNLLTTGGGADTINVNSTSATATTTIDSDSGADIFNINASALGGGNFFLGNTGDDTFNVNITTVALISSPLTIRGGANDFGAGVGSRDVVTVNDQAGLLLSPVFTYTGGGLDGSQLTVGGLTNLLTIETVETVDYNGSAALNDLATVVGTAANDLLTVAPITVDRALVFNNNTTDASGPFNGPPETFAARIPGVSGGSVRPDLDLSGLDNGSGLTVSDPGGTVDRLYVYGESETGLSDGNAFNPFGFGAGLILPAVAVPTSYDTIGVSDIQTTVDSFVAVNYNATDFVQAAPLVNPAVVINAGRETTNPVGTADDVFLTLSPTYKFQINGNDPDPATTGVVPPNGDRLNVGGAFATVDVWSTKVPGGTPIVSIAFPGSGLLPFSYSSIEDFGVLSATTVNVIGDNNNPATDQTDSYVVTGLDVDGNPADGGVGEFELVINGSLPLRFNDVQFLNGFGDDQNPPPGTPSVANDVDRLEITPYADNTPRGWGIDVSFDEGNPTLDGNNLPDLVVYNGVAGVSEEIIVQPSGLGSGQVIVNNAATHTPIVVMNYTTNTGIEINANDGSAGDTDVLVLRGTDGTTSLGTSGDETVLVDFDAAGGAASPLVQVNDTVGGALLYQIVGMTNVETVRFELDAGNDTVTVLGAVAGSFVAGVEVIDISGGAGDDSLTVNVAGRDLIHTASIFFDGGVGVDRLTTTGTPIISVTDTTYTPGPQVGAGRIRLDDGGATDMVVDFVNLEPVVDLVPAATLTVDANDADNAINYTTGSVAANGLVTIDNLESIEFSNKDNLVINALAGDDVVNLNNPSVPIGFTAGGLKTITVDGGDPTASDKVIVNGTTGGDTIGFTPTAADAADVTIAGLPDVALVATESVVINGRGGDDDLTLTTPNGLHQVNVFPGLVPDSGTVTVNDPAGDVLLGFDLVNFGALGSLTVADTGGGRADDLVYSARDLANAVDVFSVDSTGVIRLTESTTVLSASAFLIVNTPGIRNLTLNGLAGDDHFNIDGNHPFTSVLLAGGEPDASDTVEFTGSGALVTIDLDALTVAETGFGPVNLSGIEHVEVDASAANVTVNGTPGDDDLSYTPTGTNAGRVELAGLNTVFELDDVATLAINALGSGGDVLTVHGTAAGETLGVSGTTVTVGLLQPVDYSGFEALAVNGREGNDTFNVTPTTVPIFVDGGDPIGHMQQPVGDVLNVVTGGAAFTFLPGPESDAGTIDVAGTQPVSFDRVELLQIDGDNYILPDEFDQPDVVFPPNNSIATATVLGSLQKITLRNLTLHDTGTSINEDFFQITAQDTGKLIFNVFFVDALGNIDIQILDGAGNVIASAISVTDDEQITIPVVGQEQYFLRVFSADGVPNIYNVEIENFAAPVPDAVVLDPLDDTGRSPSDNVTRDALGRIIIEADLAEFAAEGIDILDAAEVAAGDPGAAVEVFVNGTSVGFADFLGASNTLFQYTFTAGELSTVFIPVGGGGGLNFVKAAVRMFDGQAAQVDARTALSEPLLVTLDATPPAVPTTPDLLPTSDSGVSNTDNITNIQQPAFAGTGEANTAVAVLANGVVVGAGVVGSDETDGVVGNGLGAWEVTVEPLDIGIYTVQATLQDLAGNISALSGSLTLIVDPFEPNNTIDTATVLGSEQKITLRDVLLHDATDQDFFQITAQDTGKLIINTFFTHALGDIDIQVQDALGNVIASSSSVSDDEQITIPVVSQQQYYLRVFLFSDTDGQGNYYDLEIENFAAPLVDNVDLPEKYTDTGSVLFEELNDTGLSQFDDVTLRTTPEIILEADLADFAAEGITILTAAQAAAGLTPGAAVEVFVNGNSVGFADPIVGQGNTLFRYTFEPGELPETTFISDSGGWLHYVKGAVRIFDGQATPASGRTQLSEPLQLVVDNDVPDAPSAPDLLETSDSGADNFDNVTAINQPAFQGTALHNGIIRVYANGIQVGEGRVGTDLTDDGFDQIGYWEVTVEPLKDGQFEITSTVEDLAGNISPASESLVIVVDSEGLEPNDTLAEATILGSLQKITINDVLLHDVDDVDFFKYTAQDTGKLIVNVFSNGDVNLRVRDANGNIIAVAMAEEVVEGLEIDGLVIPVVTQEEYWIEVFYDGEAPEQEFIQHVAVYDVEIENFAAPLVDNVDLPEKYTDTSNPLFEQLNDTGLSQFDDVTSRTQPEIILEADLNEFFEEGITILTAAQATAGLTPGAAVEVFVNGNSVGFADLIADSGNTLFRYTFEPGELPVTDLDPEASFITDSGGWLHYVKGAVRIFDGQQDDGEVPAPDPATGRTQLSEPLQLVVDTETPAAPSAPDLLETSDSGDDNFDNITSICAPAFQGTALHNGIIRVYANGVLVGEGRVGTDLTDDGFDQIGHWEVTVEPLKTGQFEITATVEDLAGNISPASEPLIIVVDPFEPNDTLDQARILGSLQKVTINDVFLHDFDDVDFFKYTAQDTGKLIVNVFSNGDIGLRVWDANGNIIAVATAEEVVEGLEIDGLVIPVVTQEEYWIEVFFNGIIIEQEIVQHVAVYDVELENFAAPLVDNVDLPEKYTDPSNPLFEQLNDTGLSQVDNVTSRTAPEIILEADLNEFFEEGISILTAAQAAAGVTPGAAVEVFVNGNSVGFADLIANSGNTLFRFTFTAGMLPFTDADPEASFITDSGGWLHYVKGAVRIFDGQQDGEGDPAPATGRTQLSEPLQLVVDTSGPGASTPNLLASSDSGRFNTDNVTHILTPAFDGTAEHNAIIRVFAIDVTDPGNPGPAELIGQGRVGTDLTQNGFNQVGSWEVTVEPLDDHSNNPSPLAHYASYRIITEVEDLAGNITRLEGNGLQIWIDAVAPNTPYLDVLGLEGPNLPGGTVSDTGRHDSDNVTFDNTPAVTVTADDTPQGDGNPFPNTIIYRIYDRPDPDQFNGAPNNGEVLLVDSFVTQGGFSANGFFLNVLPLLLDGVHNLKLEVEDLAGNMSEDFLLTVTIDTQIPPVSFGQPGDPDDGVAPDSDTGVAPPNPDTIIDRVTNDTTPKFWGRAEANTIVRVYADVNNNGTLQPGIDVYLGQTTAIPLDGNQAEPDGYWEIESIVDLNDPDFFPTPDGVRTIFITAEDLAGNVNAAGGQAADTLEIFVDTTGPVITDVYVTAVPGYDLFDPKPSTDGPSPLVYSLSIDFLDLPVRVAPDFLYDALKQDVAEQPGHYRVVGDANGVIPIQQVIVTQSIGLDNIARATVQLVFFEPLPDDRFTLTVSDSIMDPVGNRLDGENNAIEPQENPLFPTGDRVPGGEFIARFTIDSRPEIGVWAAGSVWVDTNGNFNFDPDNLDFTNRDITYVLAYTSDNVFNGNFVFAAGDTADGFDKLAAYGRVGGQYRWLIDTDNDGVPNLDVNDPASVNGLPVAGRFDNSDANGDEVGLFTGSTWWFDTNHDFRVDYSLASDLIGYPIVGDFDGDGFDDLATYADDHFEFDLANGVRRGWDGDVDATIDFGFIGVRERPVAADMNQDGIDDIGLWVPGRSGATPEELSEWYFLISQRQIDGDAAVALPGGGAVPALNHPFTPVPFGDDLYARFGDEYAMPLVGNFDPPATVPSGILPTGIAELTATLVAEPTPINTNGKVDTLPESDETIDEWESYWVEIWVDTAQTGGIGVTLALVDLTYNTDCFTPTAIEYGPAFTENRMGTIDDVAGVIDDLGAGSTLAQLGDGEYVLVARVRFEPTADDSGLAVSTDAYTDAATCNVEILEARVALADDRSATVRLASPPATELQPFIYDLDDDGEVGLGDLSYFAAAYRETIGASAVPFVHASDFDRDGEVGLGDLSYFAAAYGRGRMDFFFAAGEEAEGVAAALAESSPPPGENTASSESSTAVDAALAVEYDDRQPEAINLVDPRVAWAETVARRSLPSKNDNLDENTLAIDLFYTEEQ